MTITHRVENLEADLGPKELFLRWMGEAHGFGSDPAYGAWLAEQPHTEYPLVKLPMQICQRRKAPSTSDENEEFQRELFVVYRELFFYFYLHSLMTQHLTAALPEIRLRSVLLTKMLKSLMFRVHLSEENRATSMRLERAWPYPLDPETAQALAATERYAAQTWDEIEEGGIIGEWLDEQLRREGRRRLPLFAGLNGEKHPALKRCYHMPTEEEIRPLFAAESDWQSYLTGENYQSGFADVTDQEYAERLDKLEAGLHNLVTSGQVEAAQIIHLESIPHIFLHEVPLLEGTWIDKHVLALAEWGALLAARGFTFGDSAEDHPLAFSPIIDKTGRQCEPEDPRLATLFEKAQANLASFPGAVRLVDDRPYVSFDDYRAWPKRALKGDLRKKLSPGFCLESFNAWVKNQGEAARLADVIVTPIDPWTADATREIVAAEKLPEKLRERREILSNLDSHYLFLHPDSMGPETTLKYTLEFVEDALRWVELQYDSEEEVAVWTAMADRLSRRYFSGEDMLYPEFREQLIAQMSILESVGNIYRDSIAPMLEEASCSAQTTGEDLDSASDAMVDQEETIREKAKLRAGIIVVLAKAAALDCLYKKNDGIDLVEEWAEKHQG